MEKTERYNYVFDQYDGDSFIYDLKEDKRIEDLSECADILNKKEKEIERWIEHKKFDAQVNRDCLDKIEELETRLSNCIEPKYKTGDKAYAIIDTFAYTDVFPVEIRNTHLLYEVWDGDDTTKQHSTRMFATEEEARKKLEELKNE